MFKNLKFEVKEGICYITINKPKSLNALNADVLRELQTAFEKVQVTEEIKTVILTGEGRAFVAGADISQMVNLTGVEGQEMMKQGARVMDYIENVDKPVIAAVNGFALGGGCELAMACDMRIASDKAKFGQPEVNLGIIPGFGGTQRLPRLVGKGMAKYLIMTAEMIDANTAKEIGLVEKVVPGEELLVECEKIAKTIMGKGPLAIKASKIAINNGVMLDVRTGVAFESEACAAPFFSDERVEGMSAFLEKRQPKFDKKLAHNN